MADDPDFIHLGGLPLPIPARHCRLFREGQCRRSPCTQLHLTCPDGRELFYLWDPSALMMGGITSRLIAFIHSMQANARMPSAC